MLNGESSLNPFLSEITKAQEANNAKTEFLSNMSHEIRTPLNVIIGMCDIARHHIDDREKVDECLKKIGVAGDHLIDLVNKVLDITKIEQGKTYSKEQKFNIETLIEEIKSILEPQALNKNIILDFSTHDVINKNVVSDYCHIMQVFINLITNSIKYTPPGGFVKLSVREKKNRFPGMLTYSFLCEDNGIGMSPEFLEHIFEPFVRGEDLRINNITGAGLGMSIVKKTIDFLDGRISITSVEGEGTAVTVEFDLRMSDREGSVEDIEEFKRQKLKKLENRKIVLVAEDIEDNREILTTYLEDLGYEADVVADGEAAVDMFINSEEGFYKAVIMDIEMPVMNGYQATLMLRGLNRSDNDVPIIAMTAKAFEDDRDEAKRVGMNDYLTKPVKMDILEKMLFRWVKG